MKVIIFHIYEHAAVDRLSNAVRCHLTKGKKIWCSTREPTENLLTHVILIPDLGWMHQFYKVETSKSNALDIVLIQDDHQ